VISTRGTSSCFPAMNQERRERNRVRHQHQLGSWRMPGGRRATAGGSRTRGCSVRQQHQQLPQLEVQFCRPSFTRRRT
ncbi:hypothetical protein NDU88_006425, partial [Pleurodeles waltl]